MVPELVTKITAAEGTTWLSMFLGLLFILKCSVDMLVMCSGSPHKLSSGQQKEIFPGLTVLLACMCYEAYMCGSFKAVASQAKVDLLP